MKKYKLVKNVLRGTIIVLCLFILYSIITTSTYKKEEKRQLEVMPHFDVFRLDNTLFSRENLIPTSYTLFLYFHINCDYCLNEIQSISKNRKKFVGTQILLVSEDEPDSIKQYIQKRNLKIDSVFTVLCDKKMNFSTQFNIQSSPCTLLYDSKRKLIKRIDGQVLAETILKEMKEYAKK